ncbi:MAG: polynucleotide kinase-phosphatase [Propionibacteriaceae bacterium]|jgi:protein phosphatase|nr:polynucleotide kinase-phosphatase [Propionibacteriaceae bacterium]
MLIEIPELAVVALIGVSGSGKSTFAKQHFKPTEVLSSDYFRGLIGDDENNQQVTKQAFEALYYVANQRLALGHLTVIDATNVQKDARASVVRLAREQDCHAVAIVLNLPERVCQDRNQTRSDRAFGDHVIRRQSSQLRQSLRVLKKEGFRYVWVINSEDEIAGVEIRRTKLWNDRKDETGPFDIIGDVHGCYDELCSLLTKLGYAVDKEICRATPPEGRQAIFLGDLCDRGPGNVAVLRLVMGLVEAGQAYCVAGNHDVKLLRVLKGAAATLSHGLDITVKELEAETDEFVAKVTGFLDGLLSHYVFDGGRLVVAHAGLKESYQGRASGRVRSFCLFGDTTGETDEYGLPVRLPWANEYRGRARVVYGHTPVLEVEAVNNTYCIDTGCVFGGKLSAYRYPEGDIVQVAALREYYPPLKPLAEKPSAGDDVLNIDDVLGERVLSTRLRRSIKIRAENSAAALEVLSRFAADPHWLIYLPPTMSPCETSGLPDYLEHPTQALDYYRARGVDKVVCEQKHMGSRAVMVVARDAETAAKRFKVSDGRSGIIYTRTGRPFFDDAELELAILDRARASLEASGFWSDFATDWVCLDTELMPWSAKAQALLAGHYAPVGRAGRSALAATVAAIEQGASRLAATQDRADTLPEQGRPDADLDQLLTQYQARAEALDAYTAAYRRYCWPVTGIDDYRIAPFHLLATEGQAWVDQNHLWHLETITKYLCGPDPLFQPTNHLVVDLADQASVDAATTWWEELTASGGEGMVVKPYDFVAMGKELLQPAVKCRGREYLRIIYGPEYLLGDHLDRLKTRSLTKKRNLALAEFALGVEALERFATGEPLYRVHQCVFGILAMESEPVDPRL